MKYIITFILFALPVEQACADYFHKLVGYECDTINDRIVLSYTGAYNEAGKKLINLTHGHSS